MGITMETGIEQAGMSEQDTPVYEKAAAVIRRGGLVAFPTETVYGLGANGLDEEAASKIYKAKGRPSDNPLILHIADKKQVLEIADGVPEKAERLMEVFWPGPLTLIFKKKACVPYGTTGGLDTVAVRMPDHPVALRLIKTAQTPIAAPSANTSGKPSPTRAEHVRVDMDGKIDLILDGGPVGIGLESTIVDMTGEIPVILRPGFITKEMLETVVGSVEEDTSLSGEYTENTRPKAPGMKYRHYAPKAELTLVQGELMNVVERIKGLADEKAEKGLRVGIIATEETMQCYAGRDVRIIGSRSDTASIARNLYSVLREFDDMDVDCIFSETFSEQELGGAIMNRLVKAAGHNIIRL